MDLLSPSPSRPLMYGKEGGDQEEEREESPFLRLWGRDRKRDVDEGKSKDRVGEEEGDGLPPSSPVKDDSSPVKDESGLDVDVDVEVACVSSHAPPVRCIVAVTVVGAAVVREQTGRGEARCRGEGRGVDAHTAYSERH